MNSTNIKSLKEEKILEGVYITRNPKSNEGTILNNQSTLDKEGHKNIPNQCKYVYRSTAELIAILENDFEQNFKEIQMLYQANEDMMEYDPLDYDLIEAREENLEIINKKLKTLIDIQAELRTHCPTNPLVTKNIFDFFKEINGSENKSSSNLTDVEMNSNIITTTTTEEKDNTKILTDIEL
jgi:hypothetical protein